VDWGPENFKPVELARQRFEFWLVLFGATRVKRYFILIGHVTI
jgi:hypothetical protein